MNKDKQAMGVLDIGSYHSKFIIFKIQDNKIQILSKFILKTEGIKRGVISDLEKLTKQKMQQNYKLIIYLFLRVL